MNVLFISHCDFTGNSAMAIFSIANVLAKLDVSSIVCVPNDPTTVEAHGLPSFTVVSHTEAYTRGVRFPDGRGPDLIHAWGPREAVRKLTEHLADLYDCPYVVYLEDNEEFILEVERRQPYAELERLPLEVLDATIPDHRSHPIRYKSFLAGAAGVTVVMDRLLEFKPPGIPGIVFWMGFDDQFLHPAPPSPDLLRRIRPQPDEKFLVYSGNVHAANTAEVRSLFLAVQVLRRLSVPVRLLRTGWTYAEDKTWIEDALGSGAVLDLGFLPRAELPSLLSLATVLVQPGRCDRFNDYRFPSKLPEFFASGKPVVLPKTNIGRFVRDGIEALLLEYGDAIEIAQRVETLLKDPQLARKIGEAGRAFALRRLSWEKNAPAFVDLYKEVLHHRTRTPATGAADTVSTPEAAPAVKLISFHLPQFHPTNENDEFWGKGFTEWTNVTRAVPSFPGHYQPQLPADLGFYDLRVPEVLQQQADLAASYGIYGFCFYYYWFNGRRLLHRPLDQMLRTGRPDFPFCICWANENWTKNWDGSRDEVLIPQDYSGDAAERFIRDVIPILKDPRYIRVDGAPMLLVYRVNLIPDAPAVARVWREICRLEGIPQLHLCAVQSFGIDDPRPFGFDAAVEFPPHVPRALLDPYAFPGIREDFHGYLEDYAGVMRNQLTRPLPDYTLYRGVMPAWDNTPRRGLNAHVLVNSSPERYEEWLYGLARQTLENPLHREPFVFINAWNEWAEGAYLEPDQKLGHARLRATKRALTRAAAECSASEIPVPPPPAVSRTQGAQPPPAHRGHREPPAWARDLVNTYRSFPVCPLEYATVHNYCDSFEKLHPLATANGDLKDCQRPWIVKAILARVPRGGRILEIGAGEPLVADLLYHLGYDVWIVDPYDGSGNGPREYDAFRARYPKLRFVRSQFHDQIPDLAEHSFDSIYSISVLEHVPPDDLTRVFAGMRRFLKPAGHSIHAMDHVHRGNGAADHLASLRLMVKGFGIAQTELDGVLERMTQDTDTYYLSAEGHNRWRNNTPYAQFPMRVCVSIQSVVGASSLRLP